MIDLICPVSNEKTNERLTRLNAFFTVLLASLSFILSTPVFLMFLLIDFFIRAFTKGKYSPLCLLSRTLLSLLKLSEIKIDKAPKIFAARMGFVMTLAITLLFLLNLSIAAMAIAGILIFFATLEFAMGVCVGCMIYTYMVLPFNK